MAEAPGALPASTLDERRSFGPTLDVSGSNSAPIFCVTHSDHFGRPTDRPTVTKKCADRTGHQVRPATQSPNLVSDVCQYFADLRAIGDKCDQIHLASALRTQERKNLVDPRRAIRMTANIKNNQNSMPSTLPRVLFTFRARLTLPQWGQAAALLEIWTLHSSHSIIMAECCALTFFAH
jgi:hypothetical protein